jgi:hydroxypyruvate reductase
MELDGTDGVSLLAASSDGRDGSSRAAGALVDGRTIDRARRKGLQASAALRRHASEDFLDRAGGLIVTGPTGTNVRDWAFALRGHS